MNSYTNTITYPEMDPNIEQKGNNIGISAQSSDDIKMINNISVIDTDWDAFALSAGGTTNLVVSDNLIYGVNGPVNQDNDVTNVDVYTVETNPLFVFAGDEILTTIHDFGLQTSSPAINIANLTYAPTDDFFGTSRDENPDLGAIEYNSTLSIKTVKAEEVKIYPNPFKNQITINYKNREISEISVYNTIGQKQKFTYQKTGDFLILDLSHLSNGLYVLKTDLILKKIIKAN